MMMAGMCLAAIIVVPAAIGFFTAPWFSSRILCWVRRQEPGEKGA
jgi:hypothetical protein